MFPTVPSIYQDFPRHRTFWVPLMTQAAIGRAAAAGLCHRGQGHLRLRDGFLRDIISDKN